MAWDMILIGGGLGGLTAGALCAQALPTRSFADGAAGIAQNLAQIERRQCATAVIMERHDGAWWQMRIRDLPRALRALLRDLRHTLSEGMDRAFGDNETL